MITVLDLCQQLITYPSITPDNCGTIAYLDKILTSLGFKCQQFIFMDEIYHAPVHNLYAQLGTKGKNFCFAGHTDVVNPGERLDWDVDPFAGTVVNDYIYGRGIVDMKGAIASFVAAVAKMIVKTKYTKKLQQHSISLLITGDEEGHAANGTSKVLHFLQQQAKNIDLCLVGEPSNPQFLGEMINIGKRGSVNMELTIYGKQGHVAYPEYAHNPSKDLLQVLQTLLQNKLDEGSKYFQPSNLEFTSIDTDNTTCNIIPDRINAKFNIRFNDNYTGETLLEAITNRLNEININYKLNSIVSGEPFISHNPKFCNMISQAVHNTLNITPTIGTIGGTSDARFIQNICPVIEFGLVAATAHQINERCLIADLYYLTDIYQSILEQFIDNY